MEQGEQDLPTIAFFSNEDSSDEEHRPFGNVLVHYYDPSFRSRRKRQIEKERYGGWDTEEAFASKTRKALQSRWQCLIQQKRTGWKRYEKYFSEKALAKDELRRYNRGNRDDFALQSWAWSGAF